MPFFSVVIPAYNREHLIAATLDSVLNQEFADQEVIVVDDGSTDRTLEVLAGYGDRIRVFQQRNQGPGAARNLAIQHARGEYVSVFDSDDLRFPWTLAAYGQAIREHGNPAFVTGRPRIFHDSSEVAAVQREPLKTEAFPDFLASSDEWRWFSASSFVIRRDALNAVGGFPSARISADDCDLAMRLGVEAGFVHLRAPLTFAYREHAGSLKGDSTLAMRSMRHLLEQEATGGYPGGAGRRRERWSMLSQHVRPQAVEAARQGRLADAWLLYRATFRWHVALRRWRFLLAVPAISARAALLQRSA